MSHQFTHLLWRHFDYAFIWVKIWLSMSYDDVTVARKLDFWSISWRFLDIQTHSGLETWLFVIRMKRAFEQGTIKKIHESWFFLDFGPKSADLWLFSTVFGDFLVLRELFLRFWWHISKGFWVEENDAVVFFALSITDQNLKKLLCLKRNGASAP